MSKITFRADDELIARLEEFDASKSAIMREALRFYLEQATENPPNTDETIDLSHEDEIDQIIRKRTDELITERINSAFTQPEPRDINVNITVDGENQASLDDELSQSSEQRKTRTTSDGDSDDEDHDEETEQKQCSQCGETLTDSHVYCPNCGEKSSRRVFCDCGDEIRSDWSFCPGCGRRTPAADVLE